MTPRTTTTTPDSGLDRTVNVLRDTMLRGPELYLEVFVEGDDFEQRAFAEMFVKARCTKAKSIETADLVVFTGGVDVDPIYYGETKHTTTHSSAARDERDIEVYAQCLKEGIPMFGVCRGAQFLHVMHGGKLFQHVDKHVGDHVMWDVRRGELINPVSSVHHQMCIPSSDNGMELLGTSRISTQRWLNNGNKQEGSNTDVEAFFYRETCSFGVQGHPEYRGYHQFQTWCFEQIQDLIVNNPDIRPIDGHYRIKPDLVEERLANTTAKVKEFN